MPVSSLLFDGWFLLISVQLNYITLFPLWAFYGYYTIQILLTVKDLHIDNKFDIWSSNVFRRKRLCGYYITVYIKKKLFYFSHKQITVDHRIKLKLLCNCVLSEFDEIWLNIRCHGRHRFVQPRKLRTSIFYFHRDIIMIMCTVFHKWSLQALLYNFLAIGVLFEFSYVEIQFIWWRYLVTWHSPHINI